jgi:hypothetical protein
MSIQYPRSIEFSNAMIVFMCRSFEGLPMLLRAGLVGTARHFRTDFTLVSTNTGEAPDLEFHTNTGAVVVLRVSFSAVIALRV